MEPDQHSQAFLIARAKRFLHDLAAGEIEELADYLAEIGFSDPSRACAAIRSSLLQVIAALREENEIEQAVAVEALARQFDEAWARW